MVKKENDIIYMVIILLDIILSMAILLLPKGKSYY